MAQNSGKVTVGYEGNTETVYGYVHESIGKFGGDIFILKLGESNISPVIYLDFDSGSMIGDGSESTPTHSLKATEFLLKLDGVVKINLGSTAEKFTFDRPMTLERNGLSGSVVLGETLEASPDFESGFRVRD